MYIAGKNQVEAPGPLTGGLSGRFSNQIDPLHDEPGAAGKGPINSGRHLACIKTALTYLSRVHFIFCNLANDNFFKKRVTSDSVCFRPMMMGAAPTCIFFPG